MNSNEFKLAPMDGLMKAITVTIAAIACIFLVASFFGSRILIIPGFIFLALIAGVWFVFRPKAFVIRSDSIEICFPVRSIYLSRSTITNVRAMDRKSFLAEAGWGIRIGVGGLWGAFGWLWTLKRGMVRMYISRIDRFVWIEFSDRQPLIVSPDRTEEFIRSLSR